MKNLIFGIVTLTILISCKEVIPEAQQLEKTNLIADPTLFIGKHKTKAMVLGVFHFSNPGLDSYKPKFPFNILEKQRQTELNSLLEK